MAEFGESSYRRFLQGDKSALEELIRTYSDALVRYAYSYVADACIAEEVMEDSFAALFMKLRPIRDEAHLRSYLYRTVRSRCIDYLRRHRQQVSLEELENVLCASDTEQDFLSRERNRVLYAAMRQLSADYRDVLILTYFDELSTAQISTVMGKSAKQIYNLHARAKIALKILLEKEGITHEDL